MGLVFIYTYKLLKKNRLLFFVVLAAALSFVGFYASKIHFEEDITKMMPNDAKTERLNSILKNSKFLDRLVVTVSLADSLREPEPVTLMETSDSIIYKLKSVDTSLIKDITYKVNDDVMFNLYNTFLENLPIFLEEYDYKTLDHLITEEKLDTTLEKNYKTLLSPASVILKKNILRDLIGMSSHALKRLQSLQLDDNFELENGYIFTKDKKHLLFFITPKPKSSNTEKIKELLSDLDTIIDSQIHNSNNKVYIEYFGSALVASGKIGRAHV